MAPRSRRRALAGAIAATLVALHPDPAVAAVVSWEGAVSSSRVLLAVADHRGPVATWVSWDGAPADRFGVIADRDPRPGILAVSVDLRGPSADLTLEQDGRVLHAAAVPADDEGRPVTLPQGARGLVLHRRTGPRPAVAWGRPVQGVTSVPVDAGEWTGTVPGLPALEARAEGGVVQVERRRRLWPRPERVPRPRLVRLGLVPVTLLLLLAGATTLRRPPRGWGWGVAAAVVAALLALGRAAWAPRSTLLEAGGVFTDPPNSVATIAAITHSLGRLTDVSAVFSAPEGHSWLVLGSSWAAYLLAAPAAWLLDPLTAHNLALFGLLTLLGGAAWLLATDLGARPAAAAFAAGGAVLAPRLLGELDQLSLDRAWLFPVPLFVLALDRAARQPGWRWPTLAGCALAAVLLGQPHYGLYLATAAPLLALPRLVGPNPGRRLARMALAGAVAGLLAAPQLWVLLAGTADTPLAATGERLLHSGVDLWHPVADADATAWLERWGNGGGASSADRPLDAPQDRLLAAVANSLPPSDVWSPGTSLAGGGIYAWLVGLSLLTARARGAVVRLGLDTALLLLWSLGPFLQTSSGALGAPLPYYAAHLLVPGFESLKHPVRASFLAATLSSVPLALGLTGLTRRLSEPVVAAAGALLLAALLGGHVHWRLPSEAADKPHWAPPGLGRDVVFVWDLELPQASARPRAAALEGLHGHTAVVLPHVEPLPASAYLPCLQAGLRLVNAPPDGAPAATQIPSWWETNGLLNRLAWVSGSVRPPQAIGAPWAADLAELKAAGVDTIVVFEELLPAAGLADDVAAVLTEHASLLRREGGVSVWRLP